MGSFEGFEYYFPRRLKDTLDERGFDGKDLEDLGVISQSSIRDYLDGKVAPNLRTAIKLADFLDVSLDYLCGMDEDTNAYNYIARNEDEKAPWL